MRARGEPVRRVVTGLDDRGRSIVSADALAHPDRSDPGRIDLWTWWHTPVDLGSETEGAYEFPGPPLGGHWCIVDGLPPRPSHNLETDSSLTPAHEPRPASPGVWERGGANAFTTAMHKTRTIDYAILLNGASTLVLDDTEVEWLPGDALVDVAAWHQWSYRGASSSRVAFVLNSAELPDGALSVAEVSGPISGVAAHGPRTSGRRSPGNRRIVAADLEPGRSSLVSDGPSPDVRMDPARPGYAIHRIWVTDRSPARAVTETLHLPNVIVPPRRGTVFNFVTIPPDRSWRGFVGPSEVRGFFRMIGAPTACCYARGSPHPYMQRTPTLDLVAVLSGEVVLVLDEGEVFLRAGDFVVQRGGAHAWSNPSRRHATIAIVSLRATE